MERPPCFLAFVFPFWSSKFDMLHLMAVFYCDNLNT